MSLADYNSIRTNFISKTSKTATGKTATAPSQKKNDIKAEAGDRAADDLDPDFQDPAVTRIELVDITEKQKGYGEQPVTTLTSSFHTAKEDRGRYSEFAMLIRRKIDKEGDAVSTDVEIRSPIIRKAMQGILATYAFLNLAAVPIVIAKPYAALFHYRQEIRTYATAPERSVEERRHMKVLADFLTKNIGPAERLHQQMNLKGMITFDLLWTLFRAEDDIVCRTDYFNQIYRVVHCETKTDKDDETFFYIQAWRWGYNAKKFGPAQETLKIPEFSSTRRITQLSFFPVRCLAEKDQKVMHAQLVNRGHQWKSLIRSAYRQYDGPIWVDPPTGPAKTMAELVVHFERGRIMLDHKLHAESNFWLTDHLVGASGFNFVDATPLDRINRIWHASMFDREGPSSRQGPGKRCILNNVQCHDDDESYEMTDEEAWLCPARIRGFCLRSKGWAFFRVEDVREVEFNEDAFHSLEMEPVLKDTIRALVEMHGSSKPKFDDFITGKGKGIIMSLEGSPGAGKTLTAESVAELTHKPLYTIGAGELGSMAEIAEPVLRQIFDRATEWGAVLLLDEADLFLTKRTQKDMKRNAFVTIFLRQLEYYQGILFLTSNRIEEFDPAFSSRIHLKARFTAPSSSTRATIWRNLLMKIEECKDWDQSIFERLGKDFDLNGREIKNLIGPALTVAASKGVPLSEETLRLIYSINRDIYQSEP